MNNKKYRILSLFLIAIFLSTLTLSCSSKRFYKIVRSEPSKPNLQKYNYIHIGWLPIDENEWKIYEYETEDEYVRFIKQMNTEYLHAYIKDLLWKKNFTVATAKNDNIIPAQTELVIKFKSMELQHRGYTGVVDVDFIDYKTNTKVYSAYSLIFCKSSQWGFEPQVMDLMYYVGNFIYNQMTEESF
jgi:hypothetical protein